MDTKVKKELEKAIESNDALNFRAQLSKRIEARIRTLTPADLWPIFQKAAALSDIEWDHYTETVYDDGIDYSSQTRTLLTQVADQFANDIVRYIQRRRTFLRLNLTREIDIETTKGDRHCSGEGITRNISEGGLLFQSPTPYELGDVLTVTIPTQIGDPPVSLTGKVTRIEKLDSGHFDIGLTICHAETDSKNKPPDAIQWMLDLLVSESGVSM